MRTWQNVLVVAVNRSSSKGQVHQGFVLIDTAKVSVMSIKIIFQEVR